MRRVEHVTRSTCTVSRLFEKNYQPFVRDPPFLVPIRYPSYVPRCIEFSNRHAVLLSNRIFVAPSPQRLPNRPMNLRSFLINRFSQLTQPSTRRAAFHMYVHTHQPLSNAFSTVYCSSIFLPLSHCHPRIHEFRNVHTSARYMDITHVCEGRVYVSGATVQ